jgi:hypothetical protein
MPSQMKALMAMKDVILIIKRGRRDDFITVFINSLSSKSVLEYFMIYLFLFYHATINAGENIPSNTTDHSITTN